MKLSKWAKLQGIHYNTAKNWFHAGKIPGARQMDTGTILVDDPAQAEPVKLEKVCIYARVSNHSRKKEMDYQVERIVQFANAKGYVVDKVYKEVASGMNDKRKMLWKMLDSKPTTIIVEHKDRLTRFGFEYLERLLSTQGVNVVVMNRDAEDDKDLVKDLVSIITSFCCRLYGMRRGSAKAKAIKKELE